MRRLLQEGVRHLPVLPRHEEVRWAWTHEKELHHETVSSGELSMPITVFVFVEPNNADNMFAYYFTPSVNNIYLFPQPALPNTARCAICGEGESDESNPSTHSLMECSVCSQIAHRQCIKVISFRHRGGHKLSTLPNHCIAWFAASNAVF